MRTIYFIAVPLIVVVYACITLYETYYVLNKYNISIKYVSNLSDGVRKRVWTPSLSITDHLSVQYRIHDIISSSYRQPFYFQVNLIGAYSAETLLATNFFGSGQKILEFIIKFYLMMKQVKRIKL